MSPSSPVPTTLQTVSGSVQVKEPEPVVSDRRYSTDVDMSSQMDDEDRLHPGLAVVDKITLGSIWFVSFVYGILTDHIISKQVDLPCQVNHDLDNKFGFASVFLAIILPAVIGPIAIFFIHIVISVANTVLRNTPVSEDIRRQEQSNLVCILSLTLVFLITYVTSMVVSEVYVQLDNIFYFVLVKYIAGRYQKTL